MQKIGNASIDLILCDIPYGTTACKWDSVIPFDKMWQQLKRIRKDNAAILLFGSEPFSSSLRMSNIEEYKYDWIWDKKEFYTSGNLSYTWDAAGITNANGSVTTSTVFAGSHMVLKSSLFANIVHTPQFYDADYYCGTSAQSGEWWVTHYPTIDELKVSSSCGIFTSGGGNFISTLNATTLILQDWMPGQIANGNKVYFHK
jgi:hypothetical protein